MFREIMRLFCKLRVIVLVFIVFVSTLQRYGLFRDQQLQPEVFYLSFIINRKPNDRIPYEITLPIVRLLRWAV